MSSTNLIAPLTSFIGRTEELAEIKTLLNHARLLTLTGVGGCGKTRLAMQLATDLLVIKSYADGVWWIDLVGLNDATLVPQAIAHTLGLGEAPDISSLTDTLKNFCATRRILLVLDNCEHLLAACGEMAQSILPVCPDLQILATSREPLGIAGEVSWLVPSLPLPDTVSIFPEDHLTQSHLIQYDSICLFIERASSVSPTFRLTNQNAEAIALICRRLDGLPLAIELAAARVNVLAVQQIADRLDDRFALLTAGNRTALIPRHQTLRAAMDWSYDLLSDQEQILFRRLSVFAGGFTLEAAEATCAGGEIKRNEILDLLARLVDKSLIVADTQSRSEARFQLLETIRQYAQERLLASGEFDQIRNYQLDFFTNLAEDVEAKLNGADQVLWLDRLEADYDNIRAAISWSLENSAALTGLRLVEALFSFLCARGHQNEGWNYIVLLLSQPEALERTSARARALNAAADLLPWREKTFIKALELLKEGLGIAREINDRLLIAQSLSLLSLLALSRDDFPAAQSLSDEALGMSRELSDKAGMAIVLVHLGDAFAFQNDYKRAQAHYEESLSLFRELNDKNQIAYAFRRMGIAAFRRGDNSEAAALCAKSLTLNLEVGSRAGTVASIAALAKISAERGEVIYAVQLLGAADALRMLDSVQLMAVDQVQFDRTLATTRAKLDAAAFEEAWEAGRALTRGQAIDKAMQLTSKQTPSKPFFVRPVDLHERLNQREVEILRLIAQGLSNSEVAGRLILAVSTVKWYINNIFGKLHVHNRTQAVARGRELGLL